MAKKGFERLSNTKTRTLLLFGGFIVVVIIIIVYLSTKKAAPLKTEESRAAKIPEITSIPGNPTTEAYRERQEEENRRKAEEAKKSGGSAVATIIGTQGKDSLSKKETFGIEGLGDCSCPKTTSSDGTIPVLDPALASKLISQIEANPQDALRLMKANPGLARAICNQKPDLALKIIENDKEAAKIMLQECPAMAKQLAEKNPALFKQLLLENPDLAKKLAETNPELLKKMMEDPAFAKQMAQSNPALLKELMKNDPEFADKMAKENPELVKQLMKDDPEFAKTMAKNNPAMVKKFMLEDPEFARALAAKNPELVKDLMRGDPEFARRLAETNPSLVKNLMKGDPAFAALMAQQNPDMVKKLMADDPEFARAMAQQNPDMVADLMKNDPEWAKALRAKNPGIDTILEANRKKSIFTSDKDRLAAIEEAKRKQKEDQLQRAQQLKLSELQQKQVAAIVSNMESQSKDAFKAWNEYAIQAYTPGATQDKDKNGGDPAGSDGGPSSGAGGSGGAASADVLIKAGAIMYAVLDTAVNTDEPGPVVATITGGKYQGAKVLGDIQMAATPGTGGRAEKVIINFSTLSIPADLTAKSLQIKGVAIDLDTARTALASDIDHHYLLRYGTLFASSFMTGYAKVITSAGTVQTNSQSTGTTTTTTPTLSSRQQIFASLGEVGKQFGAATSTYFSTPNTITVDAGTGIGVLILSDVTSQ
jgi:uncharacterized protein YjeT (DUF2065 family)